MKEEGIKFIIGSGIDLSEIPEKSMIYRGQPTKRSYVRKASPEAPLPVTTTLYGFKIQPLKDLGAHGKPDQQSFWRTILGALQIGSGFEIPKKDFDRAQKAINKYNKEAKKIWKTDRKFILEKNVDANGETANGTGRVGRIK